MGIWHRVFFVLEASVFTTVTLEDGFSDQQNTRKTYECSLSSPMNHTKKSDECPTGYHGPECKGPCRFPSYGELCQCKCNCTEQHCNHITGCQEVSDLCPSTKRSSTNDAMLISTIVFTLIAVLQFSAYLILKFIHWIKWNCNAWNY